jgi:hypothetical protein
MSISNPTTSIYKPLRNGSDEIRLITIKPSSELGDEILCSIDTVELRTSPAYLALSYAGVMPTSQKKSMLTGLHCELRQIWPQP